MKDAHDAGMSALLAHRFQWVAAAVAHARLWATILGVRACVNSDIYTQVCIARSFSDDSQMIARRFCAIWLRWT